MVANPTLTYMLRLEQYEKGLAPHPGDPPPGYSGPRTIMGGPNDGESKADAALRNLRETAGEAAQVIIDIAQDETVSPNTRLSAAKYIMDLCRDVKSASGDPLIDALKTFGEKVMK